MDFVVDEPVRYKIELNARFDMAVCLFCRHCMWNEKRIPVCDFDRLQSEIIPNESVWYCDNFEAVTTEFERGARRRRHAFNLARTEEIARNVKVIGKCFSDSLMERYLEQLNLKFNGYGGKR